LKAALAMPERVVDYGGDGCNEHLCAKTGVLAALRSKIKGATYVGPGGRDMSVVFRRFDKDKSGELDEEEIRMAIRKACKIPPSVISDADISALCELLDEDESGFISIAELVDFLLADIDVEELQADIASAQQNLESLRAAHEDVRQDLQSKTRLWRINDACSKVTAIKGLGLENAPSKSTPNKKATRPRRGGPSRKVAANSRLRSKLSDAIASGHIHVAMEQSNDSRNSQKVITKEPVVLLIFAGVPWPPPQHFMQGILGGLARVGVTRPADLTMQLRDGKHLGVLVELAGPTAILEQMRRVPLLNMVALEYMVTEVVWNPKLVSRPAPWIEKIHRTVISEALSALQNDLDASGADDQVVQRQMRYVHEELRAALEG